MPTYNSVDLLDCAGGFHDADDDGNCTVCGETGLHGHCNGAMCQWEEKCDCDCEGCRKGSEHTRIHE